LEGLNPPLKEGKEPNPGLFLWQERGLVPSRPKREEGGPWEIFWKGFKRKKWFTPLPQLTGLGIPGPKFGGPPGGTKINWNL